MMCESQLDGAGLPLLPSGCRTHCTSSCRSVQRWCARRRPGLHIHALSAGQHLLSSETNVAAARESASGTAQRGSSVASEVLDLCLVMSTHIRRVSISADQAHAQPSSGQGRLTWRPISTTTCPHHLSGISRTAVGSPPRQW